jgi:hypothetical protein
MWQPLGIRFVFIRFWFVGKEVRDHWEDQGVVGSIILKWTLGR